MKMMSKVCTLLLSAVLCVGMAAPAFAYGGDTEEVEPPVLTASTDEEDAVTVTDEDSGALTPEGNLTLVDPTPMAPASSLSRWSASRATRSIWSSTGTARVRIPSTL